MQASKLNDDESRILSHLNKKAREVEKPDTLNDAYYEATNRLEQIGIAVPPELRRFVTQVAWPQTVVDEVERRLDVKALILPGEDKASEKLTERWEDNNLESESPILHKETMIFGRGFVSVGTNPEDAKKPFIRIEPSQQMVAAVDTAQRSMVGALRSFKDWDGARNRTLFLPGSTIHLRASRNGWEVTNRDDHGLGRVPLVMFLNRRRAGTWMGRSEMAASIPLTDACARALTNLQLAQEGLAVPTRYLFGADKDKMVDPKTGQPVPVWEAYYTSLMVHSDPKLTAGQFDAANLENFTKVVDKYGSLVASISGLPVRYFTDSTVNPAAEGAIRADESRLVKNVERKQTDWGDGWGWVMGLSERFATGEWPDGNKIHTEWHDAGTPTVAQKADAVTKLAGGKAILSVQGAQDELGWSEAKKKRERAYRQEELRLEWNAMEPDIDGEE